MSTGDESPTKKARGNDVRNPHYDPANAPMPRERIATIANALQPDPKGLTTLPDNVCVEGGDNRVYLKTEEGGRLVSECPATDGTIFGGDDGTIQIVIKAPVTPGKDGPAPAHPMLKSLFAQFGGGTNDKKDDSPTNIPMGEVWAKIAGLDQLYRTQKKTPNFKDLVKKNPEVRMQIFAADAAQAHVDLTGDGAKIPGKTTMMPTSVKIVLEGDDNVPMYTCTVKYKLWTSSTERDSLTGMQLPTKFQRFLESNPDKSFDLAQKTPFSTPCTAGITVGDILTRWPWIEAPSGALFAKPVMSVKLDIPNVGISTKYGRFLLSFFIREVGFSPFPYPTVGQIVADHNPRPPRLQAMVYGFVASDSTGDSPSIDRQKALDVYASISGKPE